MSEGQYQCAACGGIFDFVDEKEWSDDDARAEYAHNFGTAPIPMAVICDKCYQGVMADLEGGRSVDTTGVASEENSP